MSKQTKPKAVAPVAAKPKRAPKDKVVVSGNSGNSDVVTPAPETPQQPDVPPHSAKETNELATAPATTKLSLRDLTVQRYQSKGWQIMNTPRGGINDLVAGKSVSGKYRYHFVQFVESEDDIDNALRYKGEAKGAFIQNAYSNQATPVYVISRKQGANRKVVLENADTTQKIIP
ncbi:hypothetical protein F-liban_114 [Faustovirus]|nr:hypothetical protein F-liban_114 [Faustovirus]